MTIAVGMKESLDRLLAQKLAGFRCHGGTVARRPDKTPAGSLSLLLQVVRETVLFS